MDGAGKVPARRRALAAPRGGASEREVDVLLVGTPVNVRYLTGFTGSNGLALILAEQGPPRHRFLTDFRYATQSAAQVPDDV